MPNADIQQAEANVRQDAANPTFGQNTVDAAVRWCGDLEGLARRLRATYDVRGCRNFAGIADGMKGSVKLIYRTDEIKAN